MIEIIGAPFDLCGLELGSRLGPAAIRLAGLERVLEGLDLKITDFGDVAIPESESSDPKGMRAFEPLLEVVKELQQAAGTALDNGHMPLVIGGEHTMVVGAISACLQRVGNDLGILWIDAHGDINTPGSSVTGNIHGMPLAALGGFESGVSGLKDAQWKTLLATLGDKKLDIANVAWFGLRDVDLNEREALKAGLPISMHAIDRHNVETTVLEIDRHFRQQGIKHLWISFDVDALDPILAPGTGTAVRGGLTYREAHLMAEVLFERLNSEECPYKLAGVDIVETNPLNDNHNQTAKMAVEWIASLFGKTILGR